MRPFRYVTLFGERLSLVDALPRLERLQRAHAERVALYEGPARELAVLVQDELVDEVARVRRVVEHLPAAATRRRGRQRHV